MTPKTVTGPALAAVRIALGTADHMAAWMWVRGTRLTHAGRSAVRLTQHKDVAVRRDLARHGMWAGSPAAPALIRDAEPRVRQSLAENGENLTGQNLGDLMFDPSPRVRASVASHRSLPEPLAQTLTRDQDVTVRRILAANPNLPYPVLDRLVYDEDRLVRWLAADNPNALPYHDAIVRMEDGRRGGTPA